MFKQLIEKLKKERFKKAMKNEILRDGYCILRYGNLFYTMGLILQGCPEFEIMALPSFDEQIIVENLIYYINRYTKKNDIKEDCTLIINDDCKAVFLKRVKDYMGVPPYYAVRIIFDDENLNFPWDNGCNSEYKDQLKDIDDESIDYSKFISNDKLNVIFDHKEIDLS